MLPIIISDIGCAIVLYFIASLRSVLILESFVVPARFHVRPCRSGSGGKRLQDGGVSR